MQSIFETQKKDSKKIFWSPGTSRRRLKIISEKIRKMKIDAISLPSPPKKKIKKEILNEILLSQTRIK